MNSGKAKEQIHIGDRFGNWTVIDEAEKYKMKCRCDCGTEKDVLIYSLLDHRSTTCGCNLRRRRYKIIEGKKYNSLTIISTNETDAYKILCRCDCGKELYLDKYEVINGRIKSCGHNRKDLSSVDTSPGQVFGTWTLLTEEDDSHMIECQCQCGYKRTLSKYRLRCNKIPKCPDCGGNI